MDRGDWQTTVHVVAESRTRLSDFHFTSLQGGNGVRSSLYAGIQSPCSSVPLSSCFLLLNDPRSLMTSVNVPVSLNYSSFFFQEGFVHAFCWAIFIFVTLILDNEFKFFMPLNSQFTTIYECSFCSRQNSRHLGEWWAAARVTVTMQFCEEDTLKNFFLINFWLEYDYMWAFLVAKIVKNLPAMRETRVQSQGWEESLEKGMATHSSILAWRIPWAEEPGGYSPRGCRESDMAELLPHTHDCFTMLCSFLLCNEVHQLYVYIYLLPLGPLFHLPPSHPSKSSQSSELSSLHYTVGSH